MENNWHLTFYCFTRICTLVDATDIFRIDFLRGHRKNTFSGGVKQIINVDGLFISLPTTRPSTVVKQTSLLTPAKNTPHSRRYLYLGAASNSSLDIDLLQNSREPIKLFSNPTFIYCFTILGDLSKTRKCF